MLKIILSNYRWCPLPLIKHGIARRNRIKPMRCNQRASGLQSVLQRFVLHLVVVVYHRKPASRYEVLQLKETLDLMLKKTGIDDEEIEIKGPTQVGETEDL